MSDYRILWAALALLGLAGAMAGVAGAEEVAKPACTIGSQSATIAILLCAPGLDDATLSEAGKSACEGHRPCGVWFYDDASAMPAAAPGNHDGLTQDQVTRARGVWDNDRELLVSISRVET